MSATIVANHTGDFPCRGNVHCATQAAPRYEVKGDLADHVTAHEGSALECMDD